MAVSPLVPGYFPGFSYEITTEVSESSAPKVSAVRNPGHKGCPIASCGGGNLMYNLSAL